jgi:antitoxin (DNA-binding transcriptional repressor) of toxin-antitoxin stability system
MPEINLRQLRNTTRLKDWLRSGKTVSLRERNRVIARIMPVETTRAPEAWPDFTQRSRKIFRGRTLPGADLVIQERGRF